MELAAKAFLTNQNLTSGNEWNRDSNVDHDIGSGDGVDGDGNQATDWYGGSGDAGRSNEGDDHNDNESPDHDPVDEAAVRHNMVSLHLDDDGKRFEVFALAWARAMKYHRLALCVYTACFPYLINCCNVLRTVSRAMP